MLRFITICISDSVYYIMVRVVYIVTDAMVYCSFIVDISADHCTIVARFKVAMAIY